ncbi:carboxypeptidase regulatory-like domain-containing protein [Mucilaginibacter sp. RS28]|uniref:Carboxypeptidase regulatory-like domain-containing protein n=1 Tax=Mucilaginibacter straminoryzae TaxID=2932774 RepID=A0A9X1X7Z3_9SPHI|nr:carboxypeptidase regulatory-like domain-containing protein [Mucilaginibacter straminoryzae]MCJ8211840.1 carboxypeptidase regulatory-like domain-containing protein [Mucilaginibacter straminoryzae]
MRKFLLLFMAFLLTAAGLRAQVTTSTLTGTVVDEKKQTVPGATVVAVHTPSGSKYAVSTNNDGRFTIPGMRVGGPYTVTVSFIGYQSKVYNDITLQLGSPYVLRVNLSTTAQELSEVKVVGQKNPVFDSKRTGSSTNITSDQLRSLPTISRSLNDFIRLTPQGSSNGSFAGNDNRLNNITIDGSLFNSSFGLTGQVGGRTGVAPISLDAIQEVQVNLSPYDVRQSGFIGAGVNAVTKSGTNNVEGSIFYAETNNHLVGKNAAGTKLVAQPYTTRQEGASLGAPIVKNKLFFYGNYERQRNSRPATNFQALDAGLDASNPQVSNVKASDLQAVSSALAGLGYQTGPYQNYNFETKADRYLAKLDYNINDKNKLSVRYNNLTSSNDVLISNSGTPGFGTRQPSKNQMSFQNSNYIQYEKVNSVIAELNSTLHNNFSNNLVLGFTSQNEDRGSRGATFPLIEIQDGKNNTYISAGSEPFTPNNQLSYKTYQLIDNATYYAGDHTITGGISLERLTFRNVFFPGSQSAYVFSSMADFQSAINYYNTNPNATTSPYTLRRFDLSYSALPGGALPVQPLKVTYAGAYVQDVWAPKDNFRVTGGLRVDVPYFDKTGFYNAAASSLTFKGADGSTIPVNTAQLPKASPLFSPRLGFNWDVFNDKSLQVRGGTGIFTGRPPFVWISNQIGNNGVLTGSTSIQNTTAFPFNPNPAKYIPANPTTPASYTLNTTAQDFKFLQSWRTTLGIDKTLPFGIIGTAEFLYTKTINGVYYQNINATAANATFVGPDNRPKYPGYGLSSTAQNNALRINPNVVANYYLDNTNKGYQWSATGQLQKTFSNGIFAKAAYTFGEAWNLTEAGSTASSSYNNNPTVMGNNFPTLAFSDNDVRNRLIITLGYRKEYKIGATSFSVFYEGVNQGRFSYVYSGDMNGDGISNNDLIYIPRDKSEMYFASNTVTLSNGTTRTYTADEQKDLFDAYIQQDSYLSKHRGEYAKRNGVLQPWIKRADAAITQEFKINTKGVTHVLSFRFDMFNVGNFINKNWGVSNFYQQNRILTVVTGASGVDAQGHQLFRYNGFNSGVPYTNTYIKGTSLGSDTWRGQFTVRYSFR